MGFWDRLLQIDRRWVFLCIALSVLVPLLTGLRFLKMASTPSTAAVYQYIEKLAPGSVVMIAFDYGPSGMPEMHPMAKAIIAQCFRNHLRVVAVTLHPQGPPMADEVLRAVAPDYKARYGTDYANLGFKPGGASVVMGMGSAIETVYPTDTKGTPLRSLAVMKGVESYDDVSLLVDLATGNAPQAWLAFAYQRFHVKLAIGITAVMATDFYVYYQSGQLVGILNGMRGAAEYEQLMERPGQGVVGMSSQSIAHLVIIVFVILGNIGYFAGRRRRG